MLPSAGRRGFTLIELLIVVVVLGILAAIAIPKFSAVREKSYIASVTSDLKQLATQQSVYHSQNQVYAGAVGDLGDLTLSEGTVITINEADGRGWAATAYHEALSGRPCGMYYGAADPTNAAPATLPGVVTCTP